MNNDYKFKVLISIMIIYTVLSWFYSINTANYEFFYYSVIIFVLILVLYYYHKKIQLSLTIVTALVILGLLHTVGGGLVINGTRLYDVHFFYGLIGYDNIIHTLGTFIMALIVYHIVSPYLHPVIRAKKFRLALLLVTMTMGIGALVEIIELGGVILFNSSETVGDYFNNAWDLVFNLLGTILGTIFILKYKENKKELIKYYREYIKPIKPEILKGLR